MEKARAHHARGAAEEMRAVLPIHGAVAREPQIDLVDERGRLQGVVGPLGAHVAGGQTP